MGWSSNRHGFLTAGCLAVFLGAGWAAVAQEEYDAVKGPKLGLYRVEFRNSNLTNFELLPGGKYKVTTNPDNKPFGEGTYSFDAKESRVRWLTGRYKDLGYGGTYFVKDNKHVIVLNGLSRGILQEK